MDTERIPLHNDNGRNDRFHYHKIHRENELLFLKTATTPELKQNLQRELVWADFVNYIAKNEPNAHLRAPHMIGFDTDGGLLMEYIEAPLVASPSDSAGWKAKIDRYAQTLDLLDKYAGDYSGEWPPRPETNIDDIDTTWQRWFGTSYSDNLPLLESARHVIDDRRGFLSFRVQHGDLTPWQIFEQGRDWIIYDGEKAGDHLPRYNDLAYGYGRLFTKLKDQETAAELLEKFLMSSGADGNMFFKQFLPVMTFRATGMLADAYNDKDHNYTEEALSLLNLCLEGKLANFLPR